MKAPRACVSTLMVANSVLLFLGPAGTHAFTSIAANGTVQMTIQKSGLAVVYELECGSLAPVDVRSRIDANGDGRISRRELQAYDEAAKRKLQDAESSCFLLLDTRPVRLLPEKVEFAVDNERKPEVVLLRFHLASDSVLSPGPHRLVLESNFCPFDGGILALPEAAPLAYHRHGSLVRILKVVATGEPGLTFSSVSNGRILNHGGAQSALCLLNNTTRRTQINFSVAEAGSEQDRSSVDAITGPTPITARSPVRISEISTFDALRFNPGEKPFGQISYKLSKRAWVRIRIALRADRRLVLRTLVDWSPREAGENIEKWDGRDSAGYLIDKTIVPCFVVIDADSEAHRQHPRSLCKDLRVNLSLQNDPNQNQAGHPQRNVQITVDESTRGYGESLGYTVCAYIDFKLVQSEVSKQRAWQGIRLLLDTSGLAEGEHMLSVVVEDGADHTGSSSLKFHATN